MTNKIILDMQCTVNNKIWKLFTYDYQTEDGIFSGYFYALDFEHASYILEEMKITAQLKGQMVELNDH